MAACLRADLFPQSLAGLLNQTYSPLEIIVLVDGANPDSIRILESCGDPRVRWLVTPRPSGMVAAWNRVCREARGKYLLFCADDDILLPRAIDRQVDLLEKHPSVGFCHADFVFVDDDDRRIGAWISHRGDFIDSGIKAWPEYLNGPRCCMQTTVVRRELWESVGGWDEAGNPADNSLYLKLLRISDVGHVSGVACRYRVRTRQPDSWEKRFRNLLEFHDLSVKHLQNPPAFSPGRLKRIRRRLFSSLAIRAVAVAVTATGKKEEQALRCWLTQQVWGHTITGQVCRAVDRINCLAALSKMLRGYYRLRGLIKSLVLYSRCRNRPAVS